MTAARAEATTARRGATSPLAHPAMTGRVVLWAVVVLSVRKHAKVRSAAGSPAGDQTDGHLIAPQLHMF